MAVEFIVRFIVGFFIFVVLSAWPAMLLFGAIHSEILPVVPPFSFTDTLVLTALVWVITPPSSVGPID